MILGFREIVDYHQEIHYANHRYSSRRTPRGTQFWLNLQMLYDLRLAQEQSWKSIKALPTLKRSDPVNA